MKTKTAIAFVALAVCTMIGLGAAFAKPTPDAGLATMPNKGALPKIIAYHHDALVDKAGPAMCVVKAWAAGGTSQVVPEPMIEVAVVAPSPTSGHLIRAWKNVAFSECTNTTIRVRIPGDKKGTTLAQAYVIVGGTWAKPTFTTKMTR